MLPSDMCRCSLWKTLGTTLVGYYSESKCCTLITGQWGGCLHVRCVCCFQFVGIKQSSLISSLDPSYLSKGENGQNFCYFYLGAAVT